MDPVQHTEIMKALRKTIDETLESERKMEEQRRMMLQMQEGAFPTLSGGAVDSNVGLAAPRAQQAHKVLSLNSKTKKATLASYTPSPRLSPAASASGSPSPSPAPPPEVRVPHPPPISDTISTTPVDPKRPYLDTRNDPDGIVLQLAYVPPPPPTEDEKKGKKKGTINDDGLVRGLWGRVVPGAAPPTASGS